jgi:hypothetical protein
MNLNQVNMVNSIGKSVNKLLELALSTKSGIKKVTQPVGELGERCFPPRMPERDKKIGVRLDYAGLKEDGQVRQLNLQINKGAKDPTLKKMAEKDSHAVVATVDVEVAQEATKENATRVFNDLIRKIKEGSS